jgi:hypothetical protein
MGLYFEVPFCPQLAEVGYGRPCVVVIIDRISPMAPRYSEGAFLQGSLSRICALVIPPTLSLPALEARATCFPCYEFFRPVLTYVPFASNPSLICRIAHLWRT